MCRVGSEMNRAVGDMGGGAKSAGSSGGSAVKAAIKK